MTLVNGIIPIERSSMNVPDALIDSNIFVYAWTSQEREKHDIALRLFEKVWSRERTYAVSVQNLAEFSAVLLTKGEKIESPDEMSAFIQIIHEFSHWKVLTYDSGTIIHALNIYQEYRLHFWDSLLVATMEKNGIHQIITEDIHLQKIPWIEVINPFDREI